MTYHHQHSVVDTGMGALLRPLVEQTNCLQQDDSQNEMNLILPARRRLSLHALSAAQPK